MNTYKRFKKGMPAHIKMWQNNPRKTDYATKDDIKADWIKITSSLDISPLVQIHDGG